MDFTYLYLTR